MASILAPNSKTLHFKRITILHRYWTEIYLRKCVVVNTHLRGRFERRSPKTKEDALVALFLSLLQVGRGAAEDEAAGGLTEAISCGDSDVLHKEPKVQSNRLRLQSAEDSNGGLRNLTGGGPHRDANNNYAALGNRLRVLAGDEAQA